MADGEIKIDHEPGSAQPQPGQVIAPGSTQPPAESAPASSQPTVANKQPEAQPAAPTAPVETSPLEPPSDEASLPPPSGINSSDSTGEDTSQPADAVSWTASEFVSHEKSGGWYMGLAFVALLITGLVYIVTRDYISSVVVLVAALAFGILGARKPRQLQYRLDSGGITIGQKRLPYEAFRSFAVVPEGAFSSVIFTPLKRFAPLTTIYYAPEDEDKIVDLLAKRLPFEEHKLDAVDHLMHRIRF